MRMEGIRKAWERRNMVREIDINFSNFEFLVSILYLHFAMPGRLSSSGGTNHRIGHKNPGKRKDVNLLLTHFRCILISLT
jgi:hypothetical protein